MANQTHKKATKSGAEDAQSLFSKAMTPEFAWGDKVTQTKYQNNICCYCVLYSVALIKITCGLFMLCVQSYIIYFLPVLLKKVISTYSLLISWMYHVINVMILMGHYYLSHNHRCRDKLLLRYFSLPQLFHKLFISADPYSKLLQSHLFWAHIFG